MTVLKRVFVFVLVTASIGRAEVHIELIPNPPSPHYPGQLIAIDVYAHSEVPTDTYIFREQFDFSDSNPALELNLTFEFDLSSSTRPQDFVVSPDLPVPFAENWTKLACDPCRLFLPALGSLHLGSVVVELPAQPGTYRIDAMNADEPDAALGAQFADDHSFVWRAFTGELTGGTYDFFVEEPMIPAVSQWGAAIMAMTLIGAGVVIYRTRARSARAIGPRGRTCIKFTGLRGAY